MSDELRLFWVSTYADTAASVRVEVYRAEFCNDANWQRLMQSDVMDLKTTHTLMFTGPFRLCSTGESDLTFTGAKAVISACDPQKNGQPGHRRSGAGAHLFAGATPEEFVKFVYHWGGSVLCDARLLGTIEMMTNSYTESRYRELYSAVAVLLTFPDGEAEARERLADIIQQHDRMDSGRLYDAFMAAQLGVPRELLWPAQGEQNKGQTIENST